MSMRVCALLLPRSREAQATLEIMAALRAQAHVSRPEWRSLSDIDLIEQVLDAVRNPEVRAVINKESTTTKVGSLTEET